MTLFHRPLNSVVCAHDQYVLHRKKKEVGLLAVDNYRDFLDNY